MKTTKLADDKVSYVTPFYDEEYDCSDLIACDKYGNHLYTLGHDGGEVEDKTFDRDFRWFISELNGLLAKVQELRLRIKELEEKQ
jgi:hypothetical protein